MSLHRYLSTVGGPVAAALLFAAPPAFAATVVYTGFTVTGDSITIDTPIAATGVAGLIHLITTDGAVDAWCIDVYHALSGSGTYIVTPMSALLPGVPTLTSTQIGEIGALMVHGDQLIAAPPAGASADDVATAIQIAIWSVEYGTSGFTYNSIDPTVATLAPLYYQDAIGGAWIAFGQYAELQGTGILSTDQTLAQVIPEPSTWAMMLIGFAGLGLARYRNAKGARVAFAG